MYVGFWSYGVYMRVDSCVDDFCVCARDLLGKQALLSWWHGRGSLLDYTNPDALQWWHQQMDKVWNENEH